MRTAERSRAARQFLADAQRMEVRARIASPGHAAELVQKARDLRAAAARIAERDAAMRGDELPLL